MIRFSKPALLLAAVVFSCGPVLAQNTVPNPLRGKPAEKTQAETPAIAAEAKTDAKADAKADAKPAKPPRERSAKQRQSDDDMRACGASWRAEKDTLKANGATWRSYLKDCRAAKKAGREKV
jgi:hypothetical protein